MAKVSNEGNEPALLNGTLEVEFDGEFEVTNNVYQVIYKCINQIYIWCSVNRSSLIFACVDNILSKWVVVYGNSVYCRNYNDDKKSGAAP